MPRKRKRKGQRAKGLRSAKQLTVVSGAGRHSSRNLNEKDTGKLIDLETDRWNGNRETDFERSVALPNALLLHAEDGEVVQSDK